MKTFAALLALLASVSATCPAISALNFTLSTPSAAELPIIIAFSGYQVAGGTAEDPNIFTVPEGDGAIAIAIATRITSATGTAYLQLGRRRCGRLGRRHDGVPGDGEWLLRIGAGASGKLRRGPRGAALPHQLSSR